MTWPAECSPVSIRTPGSSVHCRCWPARFDVLAISIEAKWPPRHRKTPCPRAAALNSRKAFSTSDQPGTQHFGHASLCGKVLFGVHRIGGVGIEQHLCYPDGCRCHFAFVLTINMPVILRGHAVHDLIRRSCYDDCWINPCDHRNRSECRKRFGS